MSREEINYAIWVFSKQHPESGLSLASTKDLDDDEALMALKRATVNLLP